ncbi:3D domain-containing protein [Priestia megaterium]|uniref:3D domain-containing protein n=1 Tax=Priestia megaterium TaxID=1404 RepID=UPI00366BEF1A
MKQKITKGKVIQNCMKVSAAIVVAGGVGFLFHENHDLNADLTALSKDHKKTVHQLAAANKYAKEIEQHQKAEQQKTNKLAEQVEKLSKEKESLNKEKESLSEQKSDLEAKNKELEQKNSSLSSELKEQKDYPRQVKADTSSAKTTSPVKSEQTKKASVTNIPTPKPSATNNAQPQKLKAEESKVETKKVEKVSNQTSQPVENNAEAKQVVNGVASAYTLNEPGVTGVTASGKTVQPGMVAMDSWVPLGTKVRITCEDYPSINGVYEVADRGGAIDGNRVDIYMTSLDHAIDFGKRNIKIEILN